MKTEADIGVVWSQAKECWQPPKTGRGKEESTALPRDTDVELLASRTMKE